MTPLASRLAQVVQQNVAVGRFPNQAFFMGGLSAGFPSPYGVAPLPTAAELADYFLSLPEFRRLGLGGWQGVVADAVVSEALELIVPLWMQPEFDLLFEAVKIAAQRQRGESWTTIGTGAGASILVGLFLAWIARAA
jgi:hypothetical protein